MDKHIHLEPVDPENWRTRFELTEEQEHFVAKPAVILARAWAFRDYGSKAFIIYVDETPVGMALYYGIDDPAGYCFSEFFIDRRYQGKGYGKEAAGQVLDMMKAERKYDKVWLCYIEGNEAARKMYEGLGFRDNGEPDGDEIIMVKDI